MCSGSSVLASEKRLVSSMQGPVGGSLVDQQGFKFPRLNGQAPHAPTSAIHVRGNSGAWVIVEMRGKRRGRGLEAKG